MNRRGKTHCKNGHPLTPENTYPATRQRAGRYVRNECKTCKRKREFDRYWGKQGGRKKGEFCRNGHPMTPENTYVDPKGWRNCRQCRRNAYARHQQRLSASV